MSGHLLFDLPNPIPAGHETGDIFNPDVPEFIHDFSVLRFMDWLKTSVSQQTLWSDRPLVSDYIWTRIGGSVEIMLAELLGESAPQHVMVAHKSDLNLIIYNGRIHVVGIAPAAG